MRWPNGSVNQMFPSGPAVIQNGELRPLTGSVITPLGVIRPIFPDAPSTNHRLPSGPVATAPGNEFGVGIGKLVSFLVARSRRHTLLPGTWVNQMFPSGPAVMPTAASDVGIGNSVIVPLTVTRAMEFVFSSVNQRFPS